ncbi:hypothetical protein JHS3_08210 [Jeongeupia sp. HS-3]|uniref:hypothetical protein n=1 Tax=Jeongeupia sp. HS-3 TaxID=1009682 RepID=UPI0018A68FC9|nr:hypothetical protein [Jeongeupia sp. HS-3]BCL75085.1 hypothetical protein JHS3_08210 [Jeongeupia sp. HS-3]
MALNKQASAIVLAATLFPAPAVLAAGTQADAGKVATKASGSEEAQMLFWSSIKDSKDSAEFQAYLDQYPNGVYTKLAEIKLAKLKKQPSVVAAARVSTASLGTTAAPGGAGELKYRVSYGSGRVQALILRFDGKAWVSNDPVDRHGCLLGAITDIASGLGVLDAQQLLDEAAKGLGVVYKRKVFNYSGIQAQSWYKYTQAVDDGGLTRLKIEGNERGVARSYTRYGSEFVISVAIDSRRGVLTSIQSLFTEGGLRASCDVMLAD